ncbi:MAG: hypothetical protein AB8B59_01775 [Maribacter sp.]
MKTIITLLLLPIMVFAQPQDSYQKEHLDLRFSIDFSNEPLLNKDNEFPELMDDTIELVITFEIYVDALEFYPEVTQFKNNETVVNLPPKHLNTLSLAGLYSNSSETSKPQKRLDYLLTLNDVRFPKENTFINFLRPINYSLRGIENILQGFGPVISI